MRIVVGAMARSGSTWTFNAVRYLAREIYGLSAINAADNRLFKPIEGCEVEIIKTHATDGKQLPADKVITCVRDIRDAFASAVAANIVEVSAYSRCGLTAGVFDGMRLLFEAPSYYWMQQAGMSVWYEELHFGKLQTLRELGSFLFPGHEFNDERLQKIAIVLELLPQLYSDATERDEQYGYLKGEGRHIQGVGVMGHIDRLPIGDVVAIEKMFTHWFSYFCYPLHSEYQDIEEMLYE